MNTENTMPEEHTTTAASELRIDTIPQVEEFEGDIDKSQIWAHDGKTIAAWSLRFIITVLGLGLAGKLLSFVWDGVLPVILALLVTTVLWPINEWLFKHKFPRALASLTTLVGFLLIIVGTMAAMAPIVSNQMPELISKSEKGINKLIAMMEASPLNLDMSQLESMTEDLTGMLKDQGSNIASGVWSGVSTFGSALVALAIMLVVTFFLLKDGDSFLPWLRKYTGANVGWHLTELFTRIWRTLSGFIQAQAAVSFIDAVALGIGLVILNVPLAFVLAVIAFFGGFIPIIGAFVSGALAVIIALVTNGLTNALLVLALVILIQQLEGSILSPMLQSKAMGLHAAIVLLSVTVGSALGGILGAFLAVPVAATIAVVMRYHSEMVALRAGEITIDDIKLETPESAEEAESDKDSPLDYVKKHISKLTRKDVESSS